MVSLNIGFLLELYEEKNFAIFNFAMTSQIVQPAPLDTINNFIWWTYNNRVSSLRISWYHTFSTGKISLVSDFSTYPQIFYRNPESKTSCESSIYSVDLRRNRKTHRKYIERVYIYYWIMDWDSQHITYMLPYSAAIGSYTTADPRLSDLVFIYLQLYVTSICCLCCLYCLPLRYSYS